jgi:diacylglycerol O-acyltransferase / wax synthase
VVAGHTCKLLLLEPAPGAARPSPTALRAHVAARLDQAPRLRRRLALTPLGLAAPAWVDDAGFDLARHVRRAQTGPGLVDGGRLKEIVTAAMEERLDRSRPLWSLELVEELSGGGAALIWKLHHALADGTAAMRLADAVLWDPQPEPSPAAPPRWKPAPAPGAAGLLATAVRERAGAGARGVAAAARGAASPAAWRSAAGELRRLPGAVRRDLLPGGGPSPLDTRVSARRAVAFARASLEDLKRIEHSQPERTTVNDVVLALVGGALRRWAQRHGARPHELRVQVPVSLHDRDAHPHDLGNRDSFLCVSLPLEEADPQARLRTIAAQTRERKRQHDARTLDELFGVLRHGPRPLARLAGRLAASPGVFALSVSNVPGPSQPRWVAGWPVRELYSLAEIGQRHALRVMAISLAGSMGFGLCADPAAVEDLDALAAGIEAEAAELAR